MTSTAPSITIFRTIPAPVAEVFAAWTDAALLRKWLAPGPCEVLEATADARPGGSYRIVVVDPAGNQHTTTGIYQEVIPGKLLVKTWVYEGPSAPPEGYPTTLRVEFREPRPGTTELTIRQDGLITMEDREGNREGWRLCLNQLEELLGRPAA